MAGEGCADRLWSSVAPSAQGASLSSLLPWLCHWKWELKRVFTCYFPGWAALTTMVSVWKFRSLSEYSFFTLQYNDGLILAWLETLSCHPMRLSSSDLPDTLFLSGLFFSHWHGFFFFFHVLLPLRVFCDPTVYLSVFSFFLVFFLFCQLCFVTHTVPVPSVPNISFISCAVLSFPYRSPLLP